LAPCSEFKTGNPGGKNTYYHRRSILNLELILFLKIKFTERFLHLRVLDFTVPTADCPTPSADCALNRSALLEGTSATKF
jgi:hypothetical protein